MKNLKKMSLGVIAGVALLATCASAEVPQYDISKGVVLSAVANANGVTKTDITILGPPKSNIKKMNSSSKLNLSWFQGQSKIDIPVIVKTDIPIILEVEKNADAISFSPDRKHAKSWINYDDPTFTKESPKKSDPTFSKNTKKWQPSLEGAWG